MNATKNSIGIIGFGQMGKFMASHFSNDVFVTDVIKKEKEANAIGATFTNLEEVCKQDIVIFAVPIGKFEKIVNSVKSLISEDSIICDILSVKVKPSNILLKEFPNNKVIPLHPLFGPQSAANGIEGHKITICSELNDLDQMFLDMGIKVIRCSAEEHDKDMAKAACLSHLIGQVMKRMDINSQEIDEPSFANLVNLRKVVEDDSFELFLDIQRNNVFAEEIRDKFVDELKELIKEI